MKIARMTAIALAVLAMALAVPSWRERLLPWWYAPSLSRVKTWEYQLQSSHLAEPGRGKSDLLVVDYARSDPAGGATIPLTPAEVARLKRKKAGGKRLVLAYLSVGEAQEHRYYWKPEWRVARPEWIISENCRWPRNHLVRYWLPDWKEIIYRGPGSYLSRIVDAGFDGVYLDRIDAYGDLTRIHQTAQADMIRLVIELASEAKRLRRGFLVIAQNAELLLSDPVYRSALDGIAKEGLLYGVGGTGKRNDKPMIDRSIGQLRLMQNDGKKVLAAEYLRSAEQIASARSELKSLGIAAVFPPRALDGSDPLVAPLVGSSEADQQGTPEHGARSCDGVFPRT
jgi:cysteinyl-tRNA synthetase